MALRDYKLLVLAELLLFALFANETALCQTSSDLNGHKWCCEYRQKKSGKCKFILGQHIACQDDDAEPWGERHCLATSDWGQFQLECQRSGNNRNDDLSRCPNTPSICIPRIVDKILGEREFSKGNYFCNQETQRCIGGASNFSSY